MNKNVSLYLDARVHSIIDSRFPGLLASLLTLDCHAVAVGGSYGAGSADDWSDLDLFMYAPWAQVHILLAQASDHVVKTAGAWLTNPLNYYPGFGFRLSFLLPNTRLVELFICPPELLTITAMAHKAKFVKCNDPRYISYVEECKLQGELDGPDAIASVTFDYIASTQKLLKDLQRKDFIGAASRLQKLRTCFYAAQCVSLHGEFPHPLVAQRRAAELLDERTLSPALQSFTVTTLQDVRNAYLAMRDPTIAALRRYLHQSILERYVTYESDLHAAISATNLGR